MVFIMVSRQFIKVRVRSRFVSWLGLGVTWAVLLNTFTTPLGALWASFLAPWGHLGATLAAIGVLGRLWGSMVGDFGTLVAVWV